MGSGLRSPGELNNLDALGASLRAVVADAGYSNKQNRTQDRPAGSNPILTYTLATKWQAGAMPALLFAVAMGLHIFATDHVLAEHFPVRLTGRWRFVLAGGALTGWLVAVAIEPTGTPLINTLTAFLGGAILLNVFIDELPPERHSSFGWFVAGLVAYALLLIFATVAGKPGAA